MIKFDGIDKDNIPRVYGYAPTKEQAKEQCQLALKEYLEKRPHYKNNKYKIERVNNEN